MADPRSPTIVDVLRRRAAQQPDSPAYTFLANGERPVRTLTYGGLDRRARQIAAALRERCGAQSRVVMVYSPGLEFVEAFWACLYARVIAVPAYPPRSNVQGLSRLLAIRKDCAPDLVLSTREHVESVEEALPGLAVLATDEVPEDGDGWDGSDVGAGDVALLQYSSGSTASPKGIIVSHRNIHANQVMVQAGFGHSETSTFVGWLPFFHDMGLFGNIIHPLFLGTQSILMSPLSFLQKPVRWLRAISDYRAHTAGGPDFGYDLCVRRTQPEELEGLDLSSWKRAFNGAEKPRAETLKRFSDFFGPCGFREEAFYPCYGLAEAVLFVTGRNAVAQPQIQMSTPDHDASADAGLDSRTARAAEHVSSGQAWLEERVEIVDPATRTRRPEGSEGEVWVSGPHIAEGYWGLPELTEATFRARLASGEGPFLRTGDLGFKRADQLYVTGRLKDLIILRGHNYHPEDLEAAVEGCHPAVGPGHCAAFSVEVQKEGQAPRESLVVMIELPKPAPGEAEQDEICERAAAAVSLQFGIGADRIVLVAKGSIPKTSSGKVQRFLCRRLLQEGRLEPVRIVSFDDAWPGAAADGADALRAALRESGGTERTALLRDALARRVHALRRGAAGDGDGAGSLVQRGLDSLRMVELAQWIESACGVSVPAAELFACESVDALAERIEARLAAPPADAEAAAQDGADTAEAAGRLSAGETALYFEHEKDPAGAAYNLGIALRLTGALDRERLVRALGALLRRHPHLRTVYLRRDGELRREVREEGPLPLELVDAAGWSDEERVARITAQADRPFALDAGGVRFVVYACAPREAVLLLVVHHVLVDLVSAEIVLRDLAALYRDDGRPDALPDGASAAAFPEFVRWERQAVRSARGEESLRFWRGMLAETHQPPRLPIHRPPSADARGSGGVHRFRVEGDDTAALAALASAERATPYMVVLAAYAVLLARFARQERFVVGTSAAGRPSPRYAGTVGYFVNMLPLPFSVEPHASFREVLAQARATVSRALDHQHYPYSLLVEKLGPELQMDREGPVRYALTYGQARGGDAFLGLLGEDSDARVPFGPLTAAGFPLHRQMAPFDVTLVVLEREGRLDAAFTWAQDRVEGEAIPVLAGAFSALLGQLVRHPDTALSHLEIASAPPSATPVDAAPEAGASVLRRFEHHARTRPDAVALSFGGRHVSYGELNRRAAGLGAHLRSRGVGPETVVAVHCPRGIEMVLGILGILKAGGAYLPSDASHPAERLRMLATDAGARLILTIDALRDRCEGAAEAVVLDGAGWRADDAPPLLWTDAPPPEQLAYVIYTSGSTGRPKGVGITHGNLAGLFDGTRGGFDLGPGDAWTLFHSISFDFSVWEMWGALSHGATLVVLDQETTRDPERFCAELVARQVTVLSQTPSALYNLLPVLGRLSARQAPPLRYVVLGGEALKHDALEPWFRHPVSGSARLVNMYGITETTVHTTRLEVRPERRGTPGSAVGRALDGVAVSILGPSGERMPAWAVGEIAVGGTGVARGYLGQPGLTAARFVPDPSGAPGARRYLSGDLACARTDGDLFYLGRADQQVKVRGHRVELGEIEARIRGCAGVEWAMVLPDAAEEGAALTAWLTGDPGLTVAELRRHLLPFLPEYMIPARFVRVPAVPVTENGKVDVARLRTLGEPLESGTAFVAPRTETEQALARIWGRVLRRERVGIDDNFFALGGDSIRSIQVISLAREAGVPLELAALLRGQTLRSLSEVLDGHAPPARTEWAAPFALVADDDRRRLPQGVEDAYPADHLLQGLMFHSQFSDDYQAYVTSFHVRAPWDPDRLREALAATVRRHAFLRSSVHDGTFSEPLQLVWAQVDVPVAFEDLTGVDAAAQERLLHDWIDAQKPRKFAWDRAPLMHLAVHRRSAETFQVTLCEPFLDGWCVALFFRELFERYLALCASAAPPPDEPTRIGQRHFIQLERQALASEAARSFWTRFLEGAPESLLVPAPAARDAAALHGRRTEVIPQAMLARLRAAAGRAGVPLKTVLLAAHARLLSGLLGADEVVFGVVLNGRPEEGDGDQAIGSFLNTLPLRVAVDPAEGWQALARRIFDAETAITPHRRFPMAEIKRLCPEGMRFDTVFNFTDFHALESLGGRDDFRILDAYASEQTFFPLTLHFNRSFITSELELILDYDARALSEARVAQIAAGLLELLHAVAEDAEAPETEASSAETETSDAAPPADDARPRAPGLLERFVRHAEERPDAVALVAGERSISYAQLRGRVDALAAHLVDGLGVRPEDVVAIHAGRSAGTITALLAVLRAGAAYVPFDADGPAERMDFLLGDCRPRCILAEGTPSPRLRARGIPIVSLDGFFDGRADADGARFRGTRVHPENLAYVMYTSGSTGRPKGVGITRASLAAFGAAAAREYGIRPDDRVLQFSTLEFDISVEEIMMTVEAGAALVLRPPTLMEGYDRFRAVCAAGRVTVLDLPTAFWRDWVRDTAASGAGFIPGVRLVIIGGEAMGADEVRRWMETAPPGVELVNGYGPTETTVTASRVWIRGPRDAAAAALDARTSLIGTPFGQATVAVLDARGRPVAPEVHGEIHLGGSGVARGYLGRPALTAERFVPDPSVPGARRYRTGDVGFMGADGQLRFVGRADHQVKVRGFRVELQEVEAALLRCRGVRHAAVTADGSHAGTTVLHAFLVPDAPAADPRAWEAEVRRQLESKLPAHMVPSRFQVLDALPATPSGKVDRQALARLAAEAPAPAERPAGAAPDPVAQIVAGVLQHCLKLDRVEPEDDFFALGGDSLLGMRVAARLREALACELSVREIFDHPTVGELCRHLSARMAAGSGEEPGWQAAGGGAPALSFAQERLWMAEHLSSSAATYNIPAAVAIRGPFNRFAFEQSVREVQRRHQVLRTRVVLRDGALVPVLDDAPHAPVQYVDLANCVEARTPGFLERCRAEHAEALFDLEKDASLRIALLSTGPREHQLSIAIHHIAADGRSIDILVDEFLRLYEAFAAGLPSPLPELPVQYADFARRQKERLRGPHRQRLLDYWLRTLRGMPERTAWPLDYPRPAFNDFRGGRLWFRIDTEVAASLRRLARAESVTPFMVFLAAYKVLLHRRSGQTDLVVGTPVSNRDWPDTENLIGLFVNQLALRTDLSGNPTFRELLGRVRHGLLSAYQHRDLPFEELVTALRPRRDAGSLPLVQTLFAYWDRPWRGFRIPGLQLEFPDVHNGAAKYDLEVQVLSGGEDDLQGYFEYNLALFSPDTVQGLAREYVELLEELAGNPEAPAGAPGPIFTEAGPRSGTQATATRSP